MNKTRNYLLNDICRQPSLDISLSAFVHDEQHVTRTASINQSFLTFLHVRFKNKSNPRSQALSPFLPFSFPMKELATWKVALPRRTNEEEIIHNF